MEKQIKEVKGIIQNIRNDRKAVQIENVWYSIFKSLSEDFEKGDHVKIQYYENTKNGKTFLNLQTINILDKEDMPFKIPENMFKEKIDTTTFNTLIMTIKELYINDSDKNLEQTTEEVIKLYNRLKQI